MLKRLVLPRLRNLNPKVTPHRDERKRSGELLHLDTKKLGKIKGIGHRIHGDRSQRKRGIGWEFRIECVLTDNGSGYRSKLFAAACAELGIRHLFTRPYTPRTNGNAERFIQTMLREWAYARPYRTSNQRRRRLRRGPGCSRWAGGGRDSSTLRTCLGPSDAHDLEASSRDPGLCPTRLPESSRSASAT